MESPMKYFFMIVLMSLSAQARFHGSDFEFNQKYSHDLCGILFDKADYKARCLAIVEGHYFTLAVLFRGILIDNDDARLKFVEAIKDQELYNSIEVNSCFKDHIKQSEIADCMKTQGRSTERE